MGRLSSAVRLFFFMWRQLGLQSSGVAKSGLHSLLWLAHMSDASGWKAGRLDSVGQLGLSGFPPCGHKSFCSPCGLSTWSLHVASAGYGDFLHGSWRPTKAQKLELPVVTQGHFATCYWLKGVIRPAQISHGTGVVKAVNTKKHDWPGANFGD